MIHSKRKTSSGTIAFCGIMAAISEVLLLVSCAVGVAVYAAPLLASIGLVIVFSEYGAKPAACTYAAVSLLSVLILPDREMAFFYILFCWYPIALPAINRIRNRFARLVIKSAIYCVLVFLLVRVVDALLGLDEDLIGIAEWLKTSMFAIGGACFLFLDIFYARTGLLWTKKLRKRFRI